MAREKCRVEGKDIYATKEEARETLNFFRKDHKGRGKTYRCIFGDHYHVTKGLCGRKGRRDHR
jgi:hypothetical protein